MVLRAPDESLLKILKTELALLILCESSWLGFLSVRLAILRFRGFWLTEHSNQIGFAAVEFGGAALLGAGGGAGDCGFCCGATLAPFYNTRSRWSRIHAGNTGGCSIASSQSVSATLALAGRELFCVDLPGERSETASAETKTEGHHPSECQRLWPFHQRRLSDCAQWIWPVQ